MAKLNPKQQLFVASYIKSKNATKSAAAAGYSKKTAPQLGGRLLKNVHIKAAIEKALVKQVERLEISADRVILELARLAFVDISKAYDPNGELLNIHDMPEDVRRAIAGVDVEELFEGKGQDKFRIGYLKKLKMNDKKGALDTLAKHFKLLTDKIDLGGQADGAPLVILTMPTNGREAPKDPK